MKLSSWKPQTKMFLERNRQNWYRAGKKEIPCEVILPNGETSCKIEDVLEVRKTGFANLLNCNDNQSTFPDMRQEHGNNYIFDAEII